MKRTVLLFFVFCVLVGISWCILVEYTRVYWSSGAYLSRLSECNQCSEDEQIMALLKRIPVGTSVNDIEHYLEVHNIEPDRFTGGQFYRYQADARQILVLLSDPPWSFNLFCTSNTYFVRFMLDAQGTLQEIIIDSSGACL